MYDNITATHLCGADYDDFKWLVNEVSKYARPKYIINVPTFKRVSFKIYKHLDAVDAFDDKLRKGHSHIKYTLTYSSKSKILQMTLDNSIRKWYHGMQSLDDLTHSEYVEALKLLAPKLCLSSDFLREFKLYDLEIGVTRLFDEKFKLLTLCIIDHHYLKDFMRVNAQTVNVIGDNLTLKCYDKGADLKKRNKKKDLPKFNENECYIRSEVKITKVSGVSFVYQNLRTLNDLDANFSKAFDYLYKQLQYFKFVDCISPKIVDYLAKAREENTNNKNKNKEFHELIQFQGINILTMDRIRVLANEFARKPSSIINKYGEIEARFRELQKPSFRRLFFDDLKAAKNEVLQ